MEKSKKRNKVFYSLITDLFLFIKLKKKIILTGV